MLSESEPYLRELIHRFIGREEYREIQFEGIEDLLEFLKEGVRNNPKNFQMRIFEDLKFG